MKQYFCITVLLFFYSLGFAQNKTLLFNENGLVYTVAIPLDSCHYELKVIRRVNCDYFYWQIDGDTLVRNASGGFSGKRFSMVSEGNNCILRRYGLIKKRVVLSEKSECDKRTIFILNKFENNQTAEQIVAFSRPLIGYPDYQNVFAWNTNRLNDSIIKNTCYSAMLQILAEQKSMAFALTDSLYQEKILKYQRIRNGQFDQTPGSVQRILNDLGNSNLDAEILSCLIMNHADLFIQACVFMTENKFHNLEIKFSYFPDDIDTDQLIESLNSSSILWEKKDEFINRLQRIARNTKRWHK